MAHILACRDAGFDLPLRWRTHLLFDCPFEARGETEEEVLEQAAEHVKEAHGVTEEQLRDPEMMQRMKAIIKKT